MEINTNNQQKYQTIYLNNIIYDDNMKSKLTSGMYDTELTIDMLKKIKETINENEKENFIDNYIKEQLLSLINYYRFNLQEKDKKTIYEICNETIIYLNKINDNSPDYNSYKYYFNQVLLRNIDPYFNYGDANYYAKNKRKEIYKSIKYDLEVYQTIKSTEYQTTPIFEKIKNYEPQSEIINMFTYSIRALKANYQEIFDNEIIKNNIYQTLQIQNEHIQKYKKSKLDSWYMELENNTRTLQRILNP